MNTTVSNAFIGKSKKPTETELAEELGAGKPLWDQLVSDLTAEHGLSR